MNIRMAVQEYWQIAVDYVKQDRESQIILAILFVLLIGGGSYKGYRWYVVHRSQKAQQAFASSLDVYQQALSTQFDPKAQANDKVALWEQVEVDALHAIKQHGSTSFVPFFTAFLAHAQLYKGNRDEAIKTMTQAIAGMNSKVGYKNLYQITLDLILLDGATDEQKKQALDSLQIIAADNKNNMQDMALYYLGLYYFIAGERKQAFEYWQRAHALPHAYPELPAAQSPWQQLAEAKLTEFGLD